MTDKALSIPIPESLKIRFAKIDLKRFKKVLIASSVQPSAIIATSIICRAILRKKLLFHVRFYDNVAQFDRLKDHLNDDSILLVVGLNLIGKEPKKHKQLVLIGSRFISGVSDLSKVVEEYPVAVESLTFTMENLSLEPKELGLAAMSLIIGKSTHEIAEKIITTSIENEVIAERTGFRIPGYNFVPLNEVFSKNVHPYLGSLSGPPEPSEEIFSQADIPISRWTKPLSELTNEEQRRLNAILLLSLPQNAISHVLGKDYAFQLEEKKSPLYYFSSISSLARIIWSRHEMGLLLSILIGDRARQLDNLIEIYRSHCTDTTLAVNEVRKHFDDTVPQDTFLTIDASDLETTILSDTGRIILDMEFAKEIQFILLKSTDSLTVVWRKESPLLSIIERLYPLGIPYQTTSDTSMRILDTSEETISQVVNVLQKAFSQGD